MEQEVVEDVGMGNMLRRLRGAVGTALTWGAAWAMGGLGLIAFVYTVGPGLDGMSFWEIAPVLTFRAGVLGAMSGAVFSGLLATVHRRRRFDELNPVRMGLWGAVAGLLIPAATVAAASASGSVLLSPELIGSIAFVFGGLGLVTAAGTVRMAQIGTKELDSSAPVQLSAPPG